MAKVAKRYFTDEFKRKAVTLWQTSGLLQTDVARELGIMPTMLRRWQRILQSEAAARVGPHPDGARNPKKRRQHRCGDAAVRFRFIEQHACT